MRYAAMAALLLMMAVTILDVSMRIAINELVLGSVEVVQLALVAVVFLALPETFLRDQHITVDALDQFASARALRTARIVAGIATSALVGVMAWRMVLPAIDTLVYGDLTNDLQMSLFWYWLPMLLGILLAVAVTVCLAWRRLKSQSGDS
jgi:TRAP-type C4-dicarboxylate transport system permease small subunit